MAGELYEGFSERLSAARSTEELFAVATDSQAAFSRGEITWPQQQNLALRACMRSFDVPTTDSNN